MGASTITPKQDGFGLDFGGDGDKERQYDFTLTPEQIQKFVDIALAAPDFLKIAGDFWSDFLGGKKLDVFLKDLLKKVKVSSHPTFQITADCETFDDIEIKWFNPDVSQTSVPGLTIDAKPQPLDIVTEKCACPGDPAGKKSGRRKTRVFIIKWWVTISIKGIVLPFLGQIDRIKVTGPCCCPKKEEDTPKKDRGVPDEPKPSRPPMAPKNKTNKR